MTGVEFLQVLGVGAAARIETDPRLAEFSRMFDAEFPYVCRALRRLGARSGDVEDLAQEVFVTVYDRFDTYDRDRPIRPWLFAFAFRTASNYQRLARHRREVGVVAAPEGTTEDTPEKAVHQRQQQQLLLEALQSVPIERRSALIMHDIDGFEAKEISTALSIPVNTVYSRVRVARDELKKSLHRSQLRRGEA